MPIGFGLQPAGSSPAGLGAPDVAPKHDGGVLRDPVTLASLGGRYLDPNTRQYVTTADGRMVGMTRAQQHVALIIATELGSSTVLEMGNRLRSIKTIGASFENELRQVWVDAFARASAAGIVELLGVEPQRVGKTGAFMRLRWRDVETGEVRTTDALGR